MSEGVFRAVDGAVHRLRGTGDDPTLGARRAAVALLLRGGSIEELEVLLMRRAERDGDRWSGQIGLPGGHAEEEDETLEGTARRESVEEVGVDPGAEGGRPFGALPHVQARARGERLELFITPFVFHHPAPAEPALGPEASEAFWLPLEPALSGALDEPLRYEHQGVVHRLPSWQFEGRTIWGMTHGILRRFGEALLDGSSQGGGAGRPSARD